MIRIIIVDDHSVVRQGLRALLDTQPGLSVVAEAGSGEEALDACRINRPSLVIMDLLMSGMNGAEATRLIKANDPDCRVLILTSYHSDEYLLPAVHAGAESYLLKDVSPSALIDAVRRTAHGEAVLDPRVAQRIMRALRGTLVQKQNHADQLTDRELEVLNLIADGLSNIEIGDRLFISEKTVKTHVSNVLAKLGVSDRTQAAVFAWREGMKKS